MEPIQHPDFSGIDNATSRSLPTYREAAAGSSLLRVLKMLAPPEFIRLRGRIKAANKDVLLPALGQNPRRLRTF